MIKDLNLNSSERVSLSEETIQEIVSLEKEYNIEYLNFQELQEKHKKIFDQRMEIFGKIQEKTAENELVSKDLFLDADILNIPEEEAQRILDKNIKILKETNKRTAEILELEKEADNLWNSLDPVVDEKYKSIERVIQLADRICILKGFKKE